MRAYHSTWNLIETCKLELRHYDCWLSSHGHSIAESLGRQHVMHELGAFAEAC